MRGSSFLTLEMMSRVEELPDLQDGHQGGALAVDANDVGLWREAVAHMGHVADVDGRCCPTVLMGMSFSSATFCGAAVHFHFVFEVADLGGAGGQNQVLGADGVDHVEGREPFACNAAVSRST